MNARHSPSEDSSFSALDHINAVVLVGDVNGDVVYINKSVKRILGYEPEEILGEGWWQVVTEDEEDRKKRKEYVAGMAAGIIDINDKSLYETSVKTKDGKIIWFQWSNSQVRGNLLVGVGQVITEKKEIEEQLKRYANQVELLHNIDKHLLSMLPLEKRIENVLQELEKNISFVCRATLGVFNSETNKAVLFRKGRINFPLASEKTEVPLESIRSSQHLNGGNHFVMKNLREAKVLSETDKDNLRDGIVSYLSLPLYHREKLIGALFLCSDLPDPFSEYDIELTTDVANSLAMAIEQNNLEQSLIKKNAEKELLLKEIHHRVKNNLQVISSLLNLQSSSFTDKGTLEAFQKSKDRIHAMAIIHTKLYESGNLSEINFEDYVQQLATSISNSYAAAGIKWEASIEGIRLNVNIAINLGLIITELLTNAYKHAFKKRNEGLITIEMYALENGTNCLLVSDNGKGLPKDFELGKLNSLGLEIVQSLTEQIEGTLGVHSVNGTTFIITFDPSKNLQ